MIKNTKISLNGEWKLYWIENEAFLSDAFVPNTVESIDVKKYKTVSAAVPGNFELDLFKNKVIPDPYFGENTLLLQQFECMHMFYCRSFVYDGSLHNAQLCFEGIDTIADIYVNGELIKSVSNMLIAHSFPCTSLKQGENEIVVHIKPAVIEARKYPLPACCTALPYIYDSLSVRKAAHMYGWDIMPRIVSGGIWKDVYLYCQKDDQIDNVFAYTASVNTETSAAQLIFHYNLTVSRDSLSQYRLEIEGHSGDSSFFTKVKLWHTSGKAVLDVDDARLWYPRNYGDPNLYKTEMRLYCNNEVIDTWQCSMGIRTISLDRTGTTDKKGSGEFCIRVNNKRIFAMGTNWVPLDAFHSRDAERMPEVLPMLADLNCNIVRCWGGNVYENDSFYDYCDQNGILVWQDFSMACAVLPQEQRIFDMLEPEIVSVVKRLRNHACLALWAGDNEVDFMSMWYFPRDPNTNVITRRIIPELLNVHDFTRPYLPSSPFIDSTAYSTRDDLSEEHAWGPRDYFKGNYYKNLTCHFASEIGYHGCNSAASVKKFISPDKLWPYNDNTEWLVHAASPETDQGAFIYRIQLMVNQVKELFGQIPDNLEDFSIASQISQAEADKYFIERFRISKWRTTGIIWWNLIDGWPQFSDAVVDYYFEKKLAYHYIKRSQQPVCMMFDEPDNGYISLYLANDLQENITVDYHVTDMTSGQHLISDSFKASENSCNAVWKKPVLPKEQHFYLIEWEYNGIYGKNHFMTGLHNIDQNEYLEYAGKCGFEIKPRTKCISILTEDLDLIKIS